MREKDAATTTASEHDSIGLYSTILDKSQEKCEKYFNKENTNNSGDPASNSRHR